MQRSPMSGLSTVFNQVPDRPEGSPRFLSPPATLRHDEDLLKAVYSD